MFTYMHRFPNEEVHGDIVSQLEYFEIIYKLTVGTKVTSSGLNLGQMFFTPSLLSPFVSQESHPAIVHWNNLEPRYIQVHHKDRFEN